MTVNPIDSYHSFISDPAIPSHADSAPPVHKPLPRLRPDHELDTLERRVKDPLVELGGHLDALQHVGPAAASCFSSVISPCVIIFAHVDYVLAALIIVPSAAPAVAHCA